MQRFAPLALAALLAAPAALAQVAPPPSLGADAPPPRWASPRGVAGDTLYNQLASGGSSSGLFLSENFEPANDAADSYLADDFVVPDDDSWTVGEIIVGGFYFREGDEDPTVANETFNLIVWADDGGAPGAEVFRADAIEPFENNAGDQVVGAIKFALADAAGPLELSAGRYWLTVQANLDFTANGTRYLWYTSNVDRAELGELVHLYNYGGGFTSVGGCNAGWGEAVTAECGRTDDGTNGNVTFALLSDAPAEPVAIASARAAGDGASVFVEGVVSRAAGDYLYLQDETGGLAIRQTSGDLRTAIEAGSIRSGSTIRVTGTLSEFNGLLQISGAALTSFEVVQEDGTAPAPQPLTLAALAADGEAYEGELVMVEGVSFDALAAGETLTASTDYAVADGSGAGVVRMPGPDETALDGTSLPAEPTLVTGVVIQNSATDPSAGYKIAVIAEGDLQTAVVAVGESPDGRLGLSVPMPNPSAGTVTLTASLAAAGPATVALYDVLGREVARVLDGPLAAGDHPIRIDAAGLPAGTYLVRLDADGTAATRPLTVVR